MDRLPRESRVQVNYNSLQSILSLLQTFTHPQTRLTGPERCHIELEDNMGCGARKGQSRKKCQSTSVDPHGLKNSCPRSWNHLLETVDREKACYNFVG